MLLSQSKLRFLAIEILAIANIALDLWMFLVFWSDYSVKDFVYK